MNTKVNWNKIREELQRLDVDRLKTEAQRIAQDIRKFDFHSMLSPTAAAKVKSYEKRYAEVMRQLHKAQRHMDREFNRVLRNIKSHRGDVEKIVTEQRTKLERASKELKKRFAGKKKTARKAATRKKKTT